MTAILDALNLAVGATTHVYVKAADKWHILNSRKQPKGWATSETDHD